MDPTTFSSSNVILRTVSAFTDDIDSKEYLVNNHINRYKLLNLDPDFQDSKLFSGVENYAFNAFNPCPLGNIIKFCVCMESYLSADPLNHVVLNGGSPEQGLNRNIFMLISFFLFVGVYQTADASISGTISALPSAKQVEVKLTPSQIRFVKYFERLLHTPGGPLFTFELLQLSLITVPSFSSSIVAKGCSPHVVVTLHDDESDKTSYHPKLVFKHYSCDSSTPAPTQRGKLGFYPSSRHKYIDLNFADQARNVLVRGDINISVFHVVNEQSLIKMFSVWVHSAFIDSPVLRFEKEQVDIASEDVMNRVFDKDFAVDLIFRKVENASIQKYSSPYKESAEDFSKIEAASLHCDV